MAQYPDPRQEKDKSGQIKQQSRTVFYKGNTIFKEGSTGNRAYFIENGRVEVSMTEGNHKIVISELGPGEIVGEMALITHEPRTATVTALEDTTVTIISESKFQQKLDSLGDQAIKTLITVLVDRLKEANKGQAKHFKNLVEFQERVMGIAERLEEGVDESKKDDFKREVEPLLDELESILDKYGHNRKRK
jgi:CRP-like cAMP-binding protein